MGSFCSKLVSTAEIAKLSDKSINFVAYFICAAAHIEGEKGNYIEAENILLELLHHFPDNQDAKALLLKIYFNQERIDDAEAIVTELINDYPNNAGYYVVYASIMMCSSNYKKAASLIQEALNREPENHIAIFLSAL